MATDLASFSDPPLKRVEIGCSFSSQRLANAVEMVSFWQDQLSDDYPQIHDHPAVQPVIEEAWEPSDQLRIDLGNLLGRTSPIVRLHCMSDDRQWHAQLQGNWISVEWRKVEGHEYPRWSSVHKRFADLAQKLTQAFPDISYTQADVTYVNDVEMDSVSGIVTSAFPTEVIGPLETLKFHSHHQIALGGSEGRLHLDLTKQRGADRLKLVLTARGRPENTKEGLMQLTESAHHVVVSGFDSMITPAASEMWGRS